MRNEKGRGMMYMTPTEEPLNANNIIIIGTAICSISIRIRIVNIFFVSRLLSNNFITSTVRINPIITQVTISMVK